MRRRARGSGRHTVAREQTAGFGDSCYCSSGGRSWMKIEVQTGQGQALIAFNARSKEAREMGVFAGQQL
jgi:hypothetical protein